MEEEASLRAFSFTVVAGKEKAREITSFFGRRIEKMAEVGSSCRSSITSNYEIELIVQ